MKIGILGTAFSFHKAPFGDPSWELWACNFGEPPRWDVWFQLHDEAVINGNAGHRDWLRAQSKPIWMQKVFPDIPGSREYPLAQMVEKYGNWFFTSSIAFMTALAIEQKPEELGLWGVDMAADEEYAHQKPGVRFFLQVARLQGIKVMIPEECEVAMPGRLYCYDAPSLIGIKANARQQELQHRAQQNIAHRNNLVLKKTALQGALDIRLGPDEIRTEIEKTDAAIAEADRTALVFDGAIQENEHVRKNWTGEAK